MSDNAEVKKEKLLQAVIKALQDKKVDTHCPRCQQHKWNVNVVGLHVSTLPALEIPMPPAHLPVAVVICMTCGWTSFHNLKILGVKYD